MSGIGGFRLPAMTKKQTLSSTASIVSGKEVSEFQIQQAKATLISALADYITQSTGTTSDLQVPNTYSRQVSKSREIWGGVYSDPMVAGVMDMMVQGCVDFGSENLLKTADPESPMQKVLDHYCAYVNAGKPMVTKGLDAVRKAFHHQRWLCGGVVAAWSAPDTMTTRGGLTYKAPKELAMFPRDRFKVIAPAEGEFGGMKLAKREDLQEHQESETRQDDSKVSLDSFLESGRYQVIDRERDESAEHYPVPYLAQRGLVGICEEIRAHKAGDYATSKRIIRALLILTRGSDKWVELTDEIPELQQFASIVNALKDKDGNFVNILGADYTTEAKWVQPDLESLLSADKYTQLNMERLAALGIVRIEGTGQRVSYMYNPKPLLMEMFDAMQEDRRFIEGILFQIIVDNNPQYFRGEPLPNFRHKSPSLFLEQFEKQAIAEMFERGGLSWGTYGEQILGYGFDAAAEKRRRERETAEGYDEVFEPRVLFTQTVKDAGNKKEVEEKPITTIKAAKAVNFSEAYRDLQEQVREAAKADMEAEEKKRRIWSIVMSSIAAMAFILRRNLRDYYADQFEGTTEHMDAFQPYIEKQARGLEAFGQDLLEGKDGMTGLYALANASPGEVDGILQKSFATHFHRLSLYEQEPFRVAKLSAEAAKAMDTGKKYAVRHSAFAKTTCQECIDRHGEVIPIAEVFAGTWDHPHGLCTLTFHDTMSSARKEKEDMLTIEDINELVDTIDDMADMIFSEIS